MGVAAPVPPGLAISDIGRVLAKLQSLGAGLPGSEREVLDSLIRAAGVAPTTPVQYNPYLPGVHADPHDHYRQAAEGNPVHWSDAVRSWVVCGHDAVAAALRDPALSSRTGAATLSLAVPDHERGGVRTVSALLGSLLNELDPPEHTHRRRLMLQALAERRSVDRVMRARRTAHALLDAAAPDGRMDVVTQYAEPLAVAAGADELGVPAPDRPVFARALQDTVHTFSAGFAGGPGMRRGEEAATWLLEYLRSQLAGTRGNGSAGDVLTALAAMPEATEEERVLVAANVALGFQESVAHSTSSLLRIVLGSPEILAVARSPRGIDGVVDEGFRLETPAPVVSRTTTSETTVGGVLLPPGQPVLLLLAAAGHDPATFAEPCAFQPHRRTRHLSFGRGRHACPGARIAHELVAVAVETLLERFPAVGLIGDPPSWREELNVRGLAALPVRLER